MFIKQINSKTKNVKFQILFIKIGPYMLSVSDISL